MVPSQASRPWWHHHHHHHIIVITIVIIITPVRPHKHDQAGGHGPALFWPLKLRRFRVHILPTYTIIVLFTVSPCYLSTLVIFYSSTFPQQWLGPTVHCNASGFINYLCSVVHVDVVHLYVVPPMSCQFCTTRSNFVPPDVIPPAAHRTKVMMQRKPDHVFHIPSIGKICDCSFV